jgi:hypothetical protein
MLNRWLLVAFLALTGFGAALLASGCDDDVQVTQDLSAPPDLSKHD